MKTKHILLILLIAISVQGIAQGRKHANYNKFKTEKVAFITTQIDLTVEEAQAFWPIYNEYDKKINDLISEEQIKKLLIQNSTFLKISDRTKDKINSILYTYYRFLLDFTVTA